eukprot:11170675-Ditylum_brightwellii.AAC.1
MPERFQSRGGAYGSDWEHLFKYNHDTVCSRVHMTGKLCSGLIKMKKNAVIQRVLLYKTQQWCGVVTSPPRIPGDELGDYLTDAVLAQHKLGWSNLMKGQISKHWGLDQAIHFSIFHPNSTRIVHNDKQHPDSISTLNTQIRNAYRSLQHQLDKFNQQLFNKPVKDQLWTTPQSKKTLTGGSQHCSP